MATLAQLVGIGALEPHEPDLEHDEQPVRFIYLAPSFEAAIVARIAGQPKVRGRNLRPIEQVEMVFYEFVVGRPMSYGVNIKKLEPVGHHVWEMKTEDTRIFGWIARKGCFVAVDVEMKSNLTTNALYTPFIESVVAFRTQLNLDPPKSLTGGIVNALI